MLYYCNRYKLVEKLRIELRMLLCKSRVIPFNYIPVKFVYSSVLQVQGGASTHSTEYTVGVPSQIRTDTVLGLNQAPPSNWATGTWSGTLPTVTPLNLSFPGVGQWVMVFNGFRMGGRANLSAQYTYPLKLLITLIWCNHHRLSVVHRLKVHTLLFQVSL